MRKIFAKNGLTRGEIIKRGEEITNIFLRHGLDIFVMLVKGKGFFLKKRFHKQLKKKDLKEIYKSIRSGFEELGGAFIKLGQLLSLRPDLIPKELCEELSSLQDSTKPVAFSKIKKIIETSLGKKIEDTFSYFDKKPIASASIAQVYLAKLKNGKKVAVKIKKPGVNKQFLEDINLMYFIAKKLNRYVNYDLVHIVKEFEDYTLRELNFKIELYNLIKIHNMFKKEKDITIPNPYLHFCSNNIIVMDYIEGVKLKDVERLKLLKRDKNKIVRNIISSLLKQVFIYRFFHADSHPSNIIITKDKKIAYVDFGIIGEIDEDLRDILLDLTQSFINLDFEKIQILVKRLGKPKKDFNEEAFRIGLRDIILKHQAFSIEKMHLGRMGYEIFTFARESGINMREDLLLYAKTFVTIEGTIMAIWPNINIINVIKPIVRTLKDQLSSIILEEKIKRKLKQEKEYLRKIKLYSEEAMQRLAEGSLTVKIETKEFSKILADINRDVTLLDLGFIASALIISGSIVLIIRQPPLINGFSFYALIAFTLALILIIYIIIKQKIMLDWIKKLFKQKY